MISFTTRELNEDERRRRLSIETNLTMKRIGDYWYALFCGKVLKRFPNRELCMTYLFDSAVRQVMDTAESNGITSRMLIKSLLEGKKA